jgi:aryl-alcohol dehydrogenase-like predicted oxidoreductase
MSLRNLQVETIDLYYLHNPEMQLEELPGRVFEENLLLAFCVLERAVSQNKIKAYGLATWNGLRDEPTAQTSIQLERCVEIAQQAALKEGRSMSSFKAIQLPFNFAMPEAALLKTQKISHHEFSAFDAAQMLGLDVAVSVPLLQGQLCHQLPPFIADFFPEHFSQAHMALAFATGFGPVQNALVGMKEVDHLRHNLEFLSCPRIPQEKLVSLVRALLGRHSQ